MNIRQLTPRYNVSPQIDPGDMEDLRDAGITRILCNRPDGEGADQPSFAEIDAAAKAAGIEARYVQPSRRRSPAQSFRTGDPHCRRGSGYRVC